MDVAVAVVGLRIFLQEAKTVGERNRFWLTIFFSFILRRRAKVKCFSEIDAFCIFNRWIYIFRDDRWSDLWLSACWDLRIRMSVWTWIIYSCFVERWTFGICNTVYHHVFVARKTQHSSFWLLKVLVFCNSWLPCYWNLTCIHKCPNIERIIFIAVTTVCSCPVIATRLTIELKLLHANYREMYCSIVAI